MGTKSNPLPPPFLDQKASGRDGYHGAGGQEEEEKKVSPSVGDPSPTDEPAKDFSEEEEPDPDEFGMEAHMVGAKVNLPTPRVSPFPPPLGLRSVFPA